MLGLMQMAWRLALNRTYKDGLSIPIPGCSCLACHEFREILTRLKHGFPA